MMEERADWMEHDKPMAIVNKTEKNSDGSVKTDADGNVLVFQVFSHITRRFYVSWNNVLERERVYLY